MMRAPELKILCVFLVLAMAGCASTPQETTPDDVASAIEEAESSGSVADVDDGLDDDDLADSGESAPQPEENLENEFDDNQQEVAQEPLQDSTLEDQALAPMEEVPQEAEAGEKLADEPLSMPPIGAAMGDQVEVTNIAFRANAQGGTIVIETNGSATFQTRTNPETGQFVIEIPNAVLPSRLKRPYIMKDFGSAFAAVNAYQNPGANTVRVVIQQKNPGAGEPMVQQEGNAFLVIPSGSAPMVAENTGEPVESTEKREDWADSYDVEAASKDEKILGARSLDEFLTENNKFYGRAISIQTKDADIRDVISLIAEESGVNLVLSEDVTGSISLKLRNVPWDQALVIVMRAKKLGYVRQGNVLRISSLNSLQEETATAKRIIDSQKDLAPMRVKVIPVSFAKVEDLVKQVDPFLTAGRGKAVFDVRTSSLILTDVDEKIEKVSRLVKELDVPPAQVMIEGKIVEANEEFQRQVGVNWRAAGAPVNLSAAGGANGAPIDLRADLRLNSFSSQVAPPGRFGLSLGTLDFLGDLDATLNLAENDKLIRIVSSPRVTTMNKEKAEILQSSEVVNVTSIVMQGIVTPNVVRTPVVLRLEVTPQITSSGSVIMEVDVKRQFAGPVEDAQTLARGINTRNAKTKVLVENGQTAVIGGIYQNDENRADVGVPLLKDIPVIGWLFKTRTNERRKNELLIFLTPRIVNLEGMREG